MNIKKCNAASLFILFAVSLLLFLFLSPFWLKTVTDSAYGKSIPAKNKNHDAGNAVVNANNQFAFDLYFKLKDKEDNIFFSPWSISSALVMTYEGARGKTAQEMQSVLHFPKDDGIRRASFKEINDRINKKDKKYKLSTANALWAQQAYPFLPEYKNLIQQYYGGKITNLDFIKDAEKSRKIINTWVEQQTNNKIKDLIPPDILGPLTRLVITNAIYFKGNWLTQFNKKNTKKADFKIEPARTVKVQMMSLTRKKFNYAEADKLQILELPYNGEELSMLVLLPKENNLKFAENYLNQEKLNELKNSLAEQQVDVYIPKFKLETKYMMKSTLKEMGMPTAFSSFADFSGMDGTQKLKIDAVIHKAFVDVNEEGTEAAAATAVIITEKAVQRPSKKIIFRADHPFIFIIQETKTGNILFMGRVVNPSK
ncbi:MAG: serpin family protein [Firmicutes bacterium]|nr:serpin family protein [Bacillota bacterium]